MGKLYGIWTVFQSLEKHQPGALTHTYNPSTPEAEAEGSWVWGQPGLQVKPWLTTEIKKKQGLEKEVQEEVITRGIYNWESNEDWKIVHVLRNLPSKNSMESNVRRLF
jgi:hypothetical protein